MFGRRIRTPFLLVILGSLLAPPGRAAAPPVEEPAAPMRAGTCTAGATTLCLLGRFEAVATWMDRAGQSRAATVVPASAKAGGFSFFDSDGVDLLVQVDDGRSGNGPFAVRLGALTDAAFSLRVRDTRSGATWSYDSPRGHFAAGVAAPAGAATPEPSFAAPVEARWAVADFLEERATRMSAAAGTTESARCRATATDLCLLDGRFRVRALFAGGTRHGTAQPAGAGGETGLFALEDSDRTELAVRLVDGRAINGNFWVLASGLNAIDAALEVTDLESGRTRQFHLPGGSPTSRQELEAFSVSAATVQVTLDASRATTQAIGPSGGSIQVTDANGTKFLLTFPALALGALTEITVTPVATITGLPFAGGLKAGVRIEPEGLIPAVSALLTVTPVVPVAPAQQLTFAFRGLAGELYLTSPRANQAALILPVHRLGGYGLAAGSAADLAAQLLRLPSREEDRLSQRLAGLLLPLRRAATPPHALPATVLQLLQAEFTARIKPKLPLIQQGQVLKYWPVTQNYIDSAKDTGLAASLGAFHDRLGVAETGGTNGPVAQTNAAIVKGAKVELAKNLAACTGTGSSAAALRAYVAYNVVKSFKALGPTDTTKLLNCVNFELHFDTEIKSDDGITKSDETVPDLHLRLSLNLAQGFFYAQAQAPQTASLSVKDCTTAETGRVVATFTVHKLLVTNLGQYDDGSDLAPLGHQVAVFYRIFPPSMVSYTVTCADIPDTGFLLWSSAFSHLHLDELGSYGIVAPGDFRMIMGPSGDVRKFAEKGYERTDSGFSEDSFFFLLHTPR